MKMENTDGKIYVSYEDIYEIIEKLSPTISEEFCPEVIIGIGGGGLLPARLFRTTLKIPMYAVFISSYDGENEKRNKKGTVIKQWLDKEALKSVRGKRILIVDELNDSGSSICHCINEVFTTCEPQQVAVAVLHDKLRDKFAKVDSSKVSYYVGSYTEDQWLVYPWETLLIHQSTQKSMLKSKSKKRDVVS